MADKQRAGRMAKRILTIVADSIEFRIKDPRLQYVTITDCRMTGDLHDVTVFYTVRGATIDTEPDHEEAAAALESARGQLRKYVGDALSVRFTPRLSFELDTVPEASAHLEALLAKARQRDEELHKLSEGKNYAGGENPYREAEE
ncbi:MULTISPECIES: 30S ribosome-binding factor RbfA [Corynebacterium]|uniref:30S ribosome-binding factor RbfA n=1 Tax=Corynebacterium TaxID=1716 RepID=UPI00124D26C3|nr:MULTISPECIES: 30S ribosome-binding factor RbfA [Corynebacterium]